MPTPDDLNSIEVEFRGGYFPGCPALAPEELQGTIRRGNNAWRRPGGKIEVAKGPLEISSTNVGARIFAADTQRASFGSLVGSSLSKSSLLRYQNAVLLYVSEVTGEQVFINETAIPGLITSSVPGRLRVGLPDGVGGYSVFDAGFEKAPLTAAGVTTFPGIGAKNMAGFIGVALARWRTKTGAWGPPSEVIYQNITADTQTVFDVSLPFPPGPGQDGWLLLGTRWGDRSGQLRIFRYLYLTPRGTFTANNGSPDLVGVNTLWTVDLQVGDLVNIEATNYLVGTITDDTHLTLTTPFTGSNGSGKTMVLSKVRPEWFDGDLQDIIDRNIQRPPRAAIVAKFAERIFLCGIPDTTAPTATDATGNGFAVMLDQNPEHIGTLANFTASGSNFVNALPGDGVFYFMTTTSLEVIDRKGNQDQPFIPRIIAEPGFKAATNGCLDGDQFYGFTNRPLRTVAQENIDFNFAEPVWDDMKTWDAARVIVAIDPDNKAVLYCYDNGSTTVVIPWMTQQNVWNAPINLSARILDAQVVNGHLYVTYLSSGNIRTNQWEGGAGLSGAYASGQFIDAQRLARNRVKNVTVAGKVASLSVYAAKPGAQIPDVSDITQAEVTLTQSDLAEMLEDKNGTNIEGSAFAFRVDLSSPDGTVQKIVARGLPRGE